MNVSASSEQADRPPNNIIEHYHWCRLPKDRATQIARFEDFWQKNHPENEEYGDVIDGRFVRLCAYRLVNLYVADGKTEKALKLLRWLEEHDIEFPR